MENHIKDAEAGTAIEAPGAGAGTTFADAKVGDELGVKSTNSNALEYYRYGSCTVLEVTADRLITTRGEFMKDTGHRPPDAKGRLWQVLVSKAERAENNLQYRNTQRREALVKSIHRLVAELGDSSESVEVLDQANALLKARVAQIKSAPSALEAEPA